MMALKICVRRVAVGAAPRKGFTHNSVVPGMCRLYLVGYGPTLSSCKERERERGEGRTDYDPFP